MLKSLTGACRSRLGNILLLLRTSAPAAIYGHYLLHGLSKGRAARFKQQQAAIITGQQSLQFTQSWFGRYVHYWLEAFERCGMSDARDALEIGSWEGLSSNFILSALRHARLTCVDTWQGADEQKEMAALNVIEANFDANLSAFGGRLTKFKGTSAQYFAQSAGEGPFDLVYVDGSHHSDDVLLDAIQGFELLKDGGLMIFDDYFWRHYKNPRNNPAGAINAFLKLKQGRYRIVRAYYQLIIQKKERGSNGALRRAS